MCLTGFINARWDILCPSGCFTQLTICSAQCNADAGIVDMVHEHYLDASAIVDMVHEHYLDASAACVRPLRKYSHRERVIIYYSHCGVGLIQPTAKYHGTDRYRDTVQSRVTQAESHRGRVAPAGPSSSPPLPGAVTGGRRSGGPRLRLLKLISLREEKPSPTIRGVFWRSQLYT